MILVVCLLQFIAMGTLTRYTALLFCCLPLVAGIYCKKNSTNNNQEPPGAVELKDTVIAQNLSHPWEILWGPDNNIWITERGGRVSRLNPTTGVVTPLITIGDVVANNEGGLLGMALHPSFNTTPQVFVVYNYNNASNYREKLVRYTFNGTTLVNPVILRDNIAAASIHNGSRIVIVNDKIFLSTGDASTQASAQNASLPNGKILRLNLDGSIPADNPVANNPYWSLGHRNPQGLVFANNRLYSSEHGPNNDDEINIIEKGRNYGWPDVQGFCDGTDEKSFCNTNNVKEPLKAWTPTIATAGLDYYNSDLIPQWKNSLLMATLKNERLYQMKLTDSNDAIALTNEYFANKYGRLRDVCVSPDGVVYICSSNGSNDKIVRIAPNN